MASPGSGGAALANSRIMGLKFMQRRQQQQQPATSNSSPAGVSPAAAGQQQPAQQQQQQQLASDVEWTLESGPSTSQAAPAAGRVVMEQDARASTSDDSGALLKFRSGRRSFGGSNPRLEKRLSEIRAGQRAAREAAIREVREAEERRESDAAHAALVAREAEAEAAERESALEMANAFKAKYDKFVPPGGGLPPVVNNPIRLNEGGGGKRRKK